MYSHDSLWHVERIQNMFSLIPSQFPVRWSPSLDNGYGVPLFNFTYPAPYYLGSLFMLFGLGPVKSYDLLLLLFYTLGGVGVYLLGSKKPVVGMTAAILYLFTPYQYLDIFVRGALGEVAALGFIPWVILAYEQISKTGRLKWYSSIPFAILLLSHNFYGYLFAALLLFLIIFLYDHKKQLFYSLVLSLGLAAFFLIPAFVEKNLLLYSQTTHISYRDHFVYPLQLLYGKWSYLGSQLGNFNKEMSYQLGVGSIFVLLLAIFTLFIRATKKLLLLIIPTVTAIFLMLPFSDFLWKLIPLLPSIQYPWRFLGVVAILVPLIFIELSNQKNSVIIYAVLIALAIFGSRNYARPAYWMDSGQFLKYHYEYVGKTTTAGRDEIVPYWAPSERHNAGDTPSLSFTHTSGSPTTMVIQRNYFPTWAATMDGQKIVISPTQTGEILLPIATGTHTYRLFQKSTKIQLLGNIISILSLFGIFAIYVQGNKPNSKNHNP